jgi:hypothetical protein
MILAILASLVFWPLYLGLSLLLDIVGLVLLVPLSAAHAWRVTASTPYPGRLVESWRGWPLTWPWGNEEDGVTGPPWWRVRMGLPVTVNGPWWREALSAYRWGALRNPSNNLRFVPLINPRIDPERIDWRTDEYDYANDYARPQLVFWAFTWQGLYAGFRAHIYFRGSLYRLWLGWKLKPEDAQGVPPDDMRAPRCGWATQLKRIG